MRTPPGRGDRRVGACGTPRIRHVDLDAAEPDPRGAVVVIDVLRAFTVQPWLFARGAARVLAVADPEQAFALRDGRLPGAVLVGEAGGEKLPGFDLGNSPTEVARLDLAGRAVVHRTSAGTQGLARTVGSAHVFAASFVTATATAAALLSLAPPRVTFVITGASLGRDGDEDLACAELIAALVRGDDPDPAAFTARVATSDAGRNFRPGGPAWAAPSDLAMAVDHDRFEHAMEVTPAPDVPALDVRPHHSGG